MELSISPTLHDEATLWAVLEHLYDPSSPSFRRYVSVVNVERAFNVKIAVYEHPTRAEILTRPTGSQA